MTLYSYGMLLPCGVDQFHGTEYVCCPQTKVVDSDSTMSKEEEEEEEEDEEEDYALDKRFDNLFKVLDLFCLVFFDL